MLAIPSRTLNQATSGSGAPGPESAPRESKSTTFAKGFVQQFKFRNTNRITCRNTSRITCLHILIEIYGSTIGVCNIPMEEHSVTCKMDSTD